MIEIKFQKKLRSSAGPMLLDIDLSWNASSFISISGKSGSGKTSILRIIAGLFAPESGTIKINNQTWLDTQNKINWAPQKRNVGLVFQDYALFPHMTVRENLQFALTADQDSKIILELIEITELGDLQNRKPATLSGGQRQRVALARSMVRKPKLLLLDEPLSALDMDMRYKLQDYILRIHREYNLSTILVSHDIPEMIKLSEEIIVLDNGIITQRGTPNEVFSHKHISGKYQFVGVLVKKEKQDFLYILTILIGRELVRVIADENEVESLKAGDNVLVASKAFNPIVKKLN